MRLRVGAYGPRAMPRIVPSPAPATINPGPTENTSWVAEVSAREITAGAVH